jgi:hypothetical protein
VKQKRLDVYLLDSFSSVYPANMQGGGGWGTASAHPGVLEDEEVAAGKVAGVGDDEVAGVR